MIADRDPAPWRGTGPDYTVSPDATVPEAALP